MNSFNSLCIGACIFMIFLGFSFSFIDAMDAFPTSKTGPFDANNSDFLNVTEQLSQDVSSSGIKHVGFSEIWLIGIGAASIGAIAISILTGTTNFLGIYLFGTFFWASWLQVINIFNIFDDFLGSGAGLILITMITVGMGFMFVGAVIGMLSGAQTLR